LTGDYARPAIAWSGVQEWRTVESGNNIYTIAGGLHRINDQAGTASYARLANTSPNGLAVFQDSRSGDFDIYCTAFNGATGFPDLRVTADPAAQQYPDVAVLPSLPGEFWVVWQDYRDGNWEIYLTRSLGDEPHLALEPLHFGFAAVPGGPLPAGQELTITISGGGTPAWEADSDQPWLNVTPASGTGSGSTVNLSVNTTALPAGTYEANVAVACAEADNSPQTATVTYVVWGGSELDDKQALIDFFLAEPFYEDAEQAAQVFLDEVEAEVAAGTATSKDLEAVLRLLLLEEGAKAAYGSPEEPGADSLAVLTAKCTLKTATSLLLKLAVDKLERVLRPLKHVWGFNWCYDKVDQATRWLSAVLHRFNSHLVTSYFNQMTPLLMGQYGLAQAEAQSLALQTGWQMVHAIEAKTGKVVLEQVSEPLLQGLLADLNRWLYETGIPLYVPPSSPPDALYIGGTKHSLEAGVTHASGGDFQEGGAEEIIASVRGVEIPEIEGGNSVAVQTVNGAITAAVWAEIAELILLAATVIGLAVALAVGIALCGSTGGIGCVISALSGVGLWGALLKIANLLSWGKIALYGLGMGVGAYQLHVHLPAQLREVKQTAFDVVPKVLADSGLSAGPQRFRIPGQWSDSLETAASGAADRLEEIRRLIAAGDWDSARASMAALDSAMDVLATASAITNATLGCAVIGNQSDTLPLLDSLYGYAMAHGAANDLTAALCQLALGFASVAEPAGADCDSLLMLVDETTARLRQLGPAFDSAFTVLADMGLTAPPVVVVTEYELAEDGLGKHLTATVRNVSETAVHEVRAGLAAEDSSSVQATAETDTVIAALAAGDTGVFRWRIEVPAAETLFQMDLLIQPGTLPGDFLGDHRIVSVHFPAATYEYRCGDVTADGQITVADVTYLVAYLFRGDPAPVLPGAANVNGESGINVADVTFLIAYLFRGGPAPEACP